MTGKPYTGPDTGSSCAATIGSEAKLWLAADRLRNNTDAAEYRHVVSANRRMPSDPSGEADILSALIEADLVGCMIPMPGRLFYSTQISVCLRFLATTKSAAAKRGFRNRRKQSLFRSHP